jgi:sulfur-oxidizing protein SoxX
VSRTVRLAAPVLLLLALLAPGDARADACADFRIVGDGIPEPLAGKRGDPSRGRAVALAREQGDCTICHRLPLPARQFHGTVGPPLDRVGARLSAAQLRLRIAAPKRLNPATVMPAYCTVGGRYRVALGHVGEPILDAGQIEDLVAWLVTLDGTAAAGPVREDGR